MEETKQLPAIPNTRVGGTDGPGEHSPLTRSVSEAQSFISSVPFFQMNYRGPSPGSLLSFAINDGYPEGILRGFKLGLLGQADYANLSQCDVIGGTLAFELVFEGGCHRKRRPCGDLGDKRQRGGLGRGGRLETFRS